MTRIGILHPGEMGVSVAVTALNSRYEVFWVPDGRSEKTRERAQRHGLTPITSLSNLCRICEIIVSICPPHAAQDVAQSVIEAGFKGIYLDANAISPQRAIRLGQLMNTAGIRFVDGGIIGGPAWNAQETWLYLSGKDADMIAACFSEGPLETSVIGDEIGRASALKMCYAAYSKGTTALLAAILSAAQTLGVRQELYEHWERDDNGFPIQVNNRVTRAINKAWRFEGEMREISTTFQEAGVPGGFHAAAADVYHRMAKLQTNETNLPLEQLLTEIASK